MKRVKIVAAFIMTITLSMSVIPPLTSTSQHRETEKKPDTIQTSLQKLSAINEKSLQFLERAEAKTERRVQNYEYYKNRLIEKLKSPKKKVIVKEVRDTVYVPVFINPDTVVIEKKKPNFLQRLFKRKKT